VAGAASNAFQPASATVASEVQSVPLSTFDSVGITSSAVQLYDPQIFRSLPLLTTKSTTGAKLPWILYVGAEFCPYCAAERWPTIVALSRFGTWKGLGYTSSYSGDIYPNTPTFTFAKSTYSSKYVVFSSVEEFHNYLDSSGNWAPFQKPTATEQALFTKFDSTTYTSSPDVIPFLSFGGRSFIFGSTFLPTTLAGQTQAQIAKTLRTASTPTAKAIIASANLLTSLICYATKDQPRTVCATAGVEAASQSLKLPTP